MKSTESYESFKDVKSSTSGNESNNQSKAIIKSYDSCITTTCAPIVKRQLTSVEGFSKIKIEPVDHENEEEDAAAAKLTSLTTKELLQLLKSAPISLKAKEVLKPRADAISWCKRKASSSAKWRYANIATRIKPSKFKWHHTNFNVASVGEHQLSGKLTLSSEATLGQAWLDLAVRDLAAAETLRASKNMHRLHRYGDPCLGSVVEYDDVENDFLHTTSGRPDEEKCSKYNRDEKPEVRKVCDKGLLLGTTRSKSVSEVELFLPDNCDRTYGGDLRQMITNEETLEAKPNQSESDILDDHISTDIHANTMNYYQPAQYMTQSSCEHYSFRDEADSMNWVNEINADPLFEDLGFFGNSSTLFNDFVANDVPMENFQLLNSVYNNSTVRHPTTDVVYQQTTPSPSLNQTQVCLNEEHICNSDTDSGIHSPGEIKPSFDDVSTWRNDVENPDFDSFLAYPTSTSCAVAESQTTSIPTLNETGPLLLNMDEQDKYYQIKSDFEESFIADDMFIQVQKYNTMLPKDLTNCEQISAEKPRWNVSLTLEEPAEFQGFKTSIIHEKESVTPRKHRNKPSKRGSSLGRSRRRSAAQKGKSIHLWEFIRNILLEPQHCPSLIKWEDREQGVFRFMQSDKVAMMWGERKGNPKMTYEKLSRAMRYYYIRGILERVDGRRLVYKFGPHAHGWQATEHGITKGSPVASEKAKNVSRSEASSTVKSRSNPLSISMNLENMTFSPKLQDASLLPSANVLLGRTIKFVTS